MFTKWKTVIEEELSGRQAFRYADRIAQYHRIQASPGYRQAAQEVKTLLDRDGVEANLVSYPAQFGERFLSHFSFNEWECEHAELWIETPIRKRIARFEEEEISVIQRSTSTPSNGLEAELVVIENAEDEESYKGLELEGKMALVRGNQFVIHALAVEKYGCAGLLFDNLAEFQPIRTRMDLPDTRQYTSYWWHREDEVKSFGFVVSPRISAELRSLAKQGVVTLKASVKAQLREGHFENIEYVIPGTTDNEILVVSHLCHPYPGGQDNASGPGTLMEVMRTLTRLIKEGKLATPELGIRFLMMPEMTGTAAYFQQHPERIPYTVAALNLDMVGASQSKGGGPLCVEQPPMATPTFVDRYLYRLVEEVANNTSNFTKTTEYSTVHFVKTRFSGGSDHYIISDPTIGIPCPMLIQWPDKHYHTSSDSTSNLDEEMMRLVGVSTSLYCYGLAAGEEKEWLDYATYHLGKVGSYLSDSNDWLKRRELSAIERSKAFSMYVHYEEQAIEKLKAYAALRGFDGLQKLLLGKREFIRKQAELIWEISEEIPYHHATINVTNDEWLDDVYTRNYKAPIRFSDEIKTLSVDERLHWLNEVETMAPLGYSDFIFYWMDGKRSVKDITDLTKFETGQYYPEYTKKLIETSLILNIISKNP